MKLELNNSEIGLVLSALNEAGGNFHPMPWRQSPRSEDSKKDCQKLYNKINKQGKEWLGMETRQEDYYDESPA